MHGRARSRLIFDSSTHTPHVASPLADELFPGTAYRAVVLRGTPSSLHAVLSEVIKILHRVSPLAVAIRALKKHGVQRKPAIQLLPVCIYLAICSC